MTDNERAARVLGLAPPSIEFLEGNGLALTPAEETKGEALDHPPPWFMVTCVLRDREYGGPEEGGWWFDTMGPVAEPAPVVCHSLDEAMAAADKMQAEIDRMNEGRREVGSVLSAGVYGAHIWEGEFPSTQPPRRPRYE